MADLYPTPTRLALLRQIDAREVWSSLRDDVIRTQFGQGRVVTAAVNEMWRAGWVEPVVGPIGTLWTVTDTGRDVLTPATHATT